MTRRKAGFTLVELMIVAVIVAILAAVAIPLMSANKKRAVATEAEAGLGTLRTALRALYAQKDAYNIDLNDAAISAGAVDVIPGIGPNDLDGRFFETDDYAITAIGADSYTLTATGDSSFSDDADGIVITLDEDGNFTRAGL